MDDTKVKCSFDKSDGCHALGCFTSQECNSRDENGNPTYLNLRKLTKHDWEYKSSKVICEDCGSSYNILFLEGYYKCFECVDELKEDDSEES